MVLKRQRYWGAGRLDNWESNRAVLSTRKKFQGVVKAIFRYLKGVELYSL
jgi:hypothetical protein